MTKAARFEFVMSLLSPHDDEGRPLKPFITEAQALAILHTEETPMTAVKTKCAKGYNEIQIIAKVEQLLNQLPSAETKERVMEYIVRKIYAERRAAQAAQEACYNKISADAPCG